MNLNDPEQEKIDIFDILEENISLKILTFIDTTQHANLHLCLVFFVCRIYGFIGHRRDVAY